MTTQSSTIRPISTVNLNHVRGGLLETNHVATAIKKRWQQGETPDVTVALASHPELRQYRSVVLDLAYTEYRLRLQSGESLDPETFSRRFPSLQKSLHLLIEVHGLLSQDPELQALQENMSWPEAGSRFLQFDLVTEIGRGAFGRVFLATEPALGDRQIVVKIAPHAGGEAEILGKLRHPNVVPVYSLQEDSTTGLAAFCMPYLGRATLCDVLNESFHDGRPPLQARAILDAIVTANEDLNSPELPPPAPILRKGSYVNGVIHLASQLADALAHSHGRGIYHRDLKPSNVLLTADGRPLLLDFNLSINAGLPAWKVGGTLPYMAPEELAHLVRMKTESHVLHYDPRSDLFSLGVIFYELLTGKLPFGTILWDRPLEEVADQLRQQQAKGPQPIGERNNQVDRRLARLVESCLSFDPENRPESAQQLAVALRQELSTVRRSRRWIGNHPRRVFGAGAMTLLLGLAVILFFALRPPYSDRQLQLGLGQLEQGKYASAVASLSNSIDANPTSGEALFARGRAYQREEKFLLAKQDYNSAFQLTLNPAAKACEGYCLSQAKYPREAILAYTKALESGYSSPAILHNNIAFSYLLFAEIDSAEKSLQQALLLDGKIQAVHYNMVIVFLQRALRGKTIPKVALFHATRAIEIGPPSADLFHCISALYATAARQDPTLVQPAIVYVAKAVELGCKPERFTSDIQFTPLQKEAAFRDALRRPVKLPQSSAAIKQLLDPLDVR